MSSSNGDGGSEIGHIQSTSIIDVRSRRRRRNPARENEYLPHSHVSQSGEGGDAMKIVGIRDPSCTSDLSCFTAIIAKSNISVSDSFSSDGADSVGHSTMVNHVSKYIKTDNFQATYVEKTSEPNYATTKSLNTERGSVVHIIEAKDETSYSPSELKNVEIVHDSEETKDSPPAPISPPCASVVTELLDHNKMSHTISIRHQNILEMIQNCVKFIPEKLRKRPPDPSMIPLLPPYELWYNFKKASMTQPELKNTTAQNGLPSTVLSEDLITSLIPGLNEVIAEWDKTQCTEDIQNMRAESPLLSRSVRTDETHECQIGEEPITMSTVLSPHSERELVASFDSIASLKDTNGNVISPGPMSRSSSILSSVNSNATGHTPNDNGKRAEMSPDLSNTIANMKPDNLSTAYTTYSYLQSLEEFGNSLFARISGTNSLFYSSLHDVSREGVADLCGSEVSTQLTLLKERERELHKFFPQPKYVNERRVIVDWMCEFGELFRLTDLTLHLAVRFVDIVLGQFYSESEGASRPKDKIQTIVTACVFVAIKFEELEARAPTVKALRESSGNGIECKDIIEQERFVLSKLGWRLARVTCVHYLHIYVQQGLLAPEDRVGGSPPTSRIVRFVAKYVSFFAELLLQVYEMTEFLPSIQAAAIVACARRAVKTEPIWNKLVEKVTSCTEKDVYRCYKILYDYYLASFPNVASAASEQCIAEFEKAAGVSPQ